MTGAGDAVRRPRFGVWAPVYGTWGSRTHPDEAPDASYRRTRDLLVRAEQLGFDATLIAQHLIHPGDPRDDQLETWSTVAAIAEATSRIEIIGAVKPLLIPPLLFAKFVANAAAISAGRVSINLVSGWYLPELVAAGVDGPDHDSRYVHSREWLDAVRGLWEGHVFDGTDNRLVGAGARVRPLPARTPTIYLGGESEPARRLAADRADVFFLNGRPVDEVREIVADLRARRAPDAPALRFGLSAFVIVRPTDAEADTELVRLQGYSNDSGRRDRTTGADPQTAMFKVHEGEVRVGTNGGTLAGLVGDPERVTARIREFVDAGIDLFMLQFQPLEDEMERFAREVLPRFAAIDTGKGRS